MQAIGTGMTLGTFVKERRARLGLTQKALTERIPNRDDSWVSRIENDLIKHPLDAEAVADLARALECSQIDILEAQGFEVRTCEAAAPPPVDIDWDDPTMQLWSATGQMYTPEEREYLAKILNREAKDKGD